MRMALAACGILKTEKQVSRLMGTNKVSGTDNKDFPTVAERYKLSYVVRRHSNWEDIKHYLKEGFTIIVGFFSPHEQRDHYAVVKKIDSKHIWLWDPRVGPNNKYALTYFMEIWRKEQTYDKDHAWMFGVKKGNHHHI